MQPDDNKGRIMSAKDVIAATSLSRSTIWRLCSAGDFPASIRLSANRVGWGREEVERWVWRRSQGRAEKGE
jgi:prophage regulatory protein